MKWFREHMCNSIYCYISLFHRLQKRRLCLWGSTVNLICQKQIAHNCTFLILKTSEFLPIKRESCNICRKNIRSKLDTVLFQIKYLRKCKRKARLSDSRNIFHQNMASCKNCFHDFLHTFIFSNNHMLYGINRFLQLPIILHCLLLHVLFLMF